MPPRKLQDFQPIHFRFTHKSETDLESFILFIRRYAVKTLIVFEDADEEVNRPHLHSILYVKETLTNFRKQFKKKFPDYGRGDFGSCVIESIEKMERYLCKGKGRLEPADLRLVTEYGMDIIDIRHTEYWDENDRLRTQTKTKPAPKEKAKTWMQCVTDELIEEYNQQQIVPTEIGKFSYTRDIKMMVYVKIMKCLGRTSKKLSPKIVRELCDGQLNVLCGKALREYMWENVFPEEDRSLLYIEEGWKL